jgi:hypothetical protein
MANEFVKYPTIGIAYRHYKGGLYEVLHLATHTTTKETLVIYKSMLYGTFYARPLTEWFERVKLSDSCSLMSRFEIATLDE